MRGLWLGIALVVLFAGAALVSFFWVPYDIARARLGWALL